MFWPAIFFWRTVRKHPRLSLIIVFVISVASGVAGFTIWSDYQLRAASDALREDRLLEASQHIQRYLTVHRTSAPAHLLAARIERSRGDYPAAESHLTECVRLQGGASEATQMEWLLMRAQRGDLDSVGPGLLESLERNHAETDAILEAFVRGFMLQGRYQAALVCLDRWLQRSPDTARALDRRGWILERMSNRESARRDYERALELDPGRTEVRLRLADILLDSKQSEEAERHLEVLRKQQPHRPEVLTALARCRILQRKFEEARGLLDAALAEAPEDAEVLLYRAKLELEDDDRTAEAIHWAERALAADPYSLQADYTLYRALQAQEGRQSEAADRLKHYESLKADMDRLRVLLSLESERAITDSALATEIGTLLLRTGQDKLGVNWLNVALRADRAYKPAHRELARYYERTGQPDLAAEQRKAAGD